jgi:neurotransmitter:Na+ symporter, NSS family
MTRNAREHWSSRFGFVMAAAGSAIGLGTLWRVPYLTGEHGGGAFFLVYLLCILVVGIPIFIAELLIGRKTHHAPILAFEALDRPNSSWGVAGWLSVACSFLIMSYYSVIAGFGLNYFFMSLNQFWIGKTPDEIGQAFDILTSSGDICLFWHFCFTALTTAIVYHGIRRGIEHTTRIVTSSLLVLLISFFIYNCTLSGFPEAFRFILAPDIDKLTPDAILEALGLAFFTLSLGQGIMITYGSYMRRDEDIPATALIIAAMVCVVALLSAFSVFPTVFTFHQSPHGGFGLIFKTMPALFASLPGALLISAFFFLLFVFAALGAALALTEVMVATLMDIYGWPRKKVALAVGSAIFILGIPSALSGSSTLFASWSLLYGSSFIETIDHITSAWLLPTSGLLICLFAGRHIHHAVAKDEFCAHSSVRFLFYPWYFFIRYITPVCIIFIFLQRTGCLSLDVWMQRIFR